MNFWHSILAHLLMLNSSGELDKAIDNSLVAPPNHERLVCNVDIFCTFLMIHNESLGLSIPFLRIFVCKQT